MKLGLGRRAGWISGAMALVLLPVSLMAQGGGQTGAAVLRPESYRHYVEMFREQEKEATGKEGADSWAWMQKEIPWFDSSDKQFEEMYYFRWYAWQKHLVETKRGYVITEWLPKPEAKDGFFGALPDAAPFHIGEARWLREKKIAEDDARYWMSPDADPRKYSFWVASTVRGLTLANGDAALGTELLPALKANYAAWETSNQDANGLFWSDRHAGCDGEVDQRRWIQADAEQLHVWRCAGDCGDGGQRAMRPRRRSSRQRRTSCMS